MSSRAWNMTLNVVFRRSVFSNIYMGFSPTINYSRCGAMTKKTLSRKQAIMHKARIMSDPTELSGTVAGKTISEMLYTDPFFSMQFIRTT